MSGLLLMPTVPASFADLTQAEIALIMAFRVMGDANARMFHGLGLDLAAKDRKKPAPRLTLVPTRVDGGAQ